MVSRVTTRDRVVFLTVDDGWHRSAPVLRSLGRRPAPMTAFLTSDAVEAEPRWFRRLSAVGVDVGGHSRRHPVLRGLPHTAQRAEICGSKRTLQRILDVTPRLFRPPYGAFDDSTRRITASCYRPYLVSWSVTVDGRDVSFRSPGGLRRGDIVLLHFGPRLHVELRTILRLSKARGLEPARLESYLPDPRRP